MTRLLIVTHYFADHQGGIEIVAGQLARRLAQRGLQVTWAASGPPPAIPIPGVEFVSMKAWNGCERCWGIPYPVWSCASLRRLFTEVRRADVVHLHETLYHGNFCAFLAAAWWRKPLFVTQHVGDIPFRNWLLRALFRIANHTVARLVLSRARSVIFISEHVQRYFSSFVRFRGSVRLLPNGVDTDVFHPALAADRLESRRELGWAPDRMHMLFVGRFVEKKGVHLLRQLAERFPQCTWAFVGWGPLDPSHWGLGNVINMGRVPQDQLPRHYQAADIFILPSVGEGFPLVVQEAMACGVTVCLTGEVAEGLPGVSCRVLTADPNIEDMSAVIRQILRDPDALTSLRTEAAEYARAVWDWEQCASGYLDIIHEIIEDSKVRC